MSELNINLPKEELLCFYFLNMKGLEKGLMKVIASCFLFNMLEYIVNSSYELRGSLPPILSLAEQLLFGF